MKKIILATLIFVIGCCALFAGCSTLATLEVKQDTIKTIYKLNEVIDLDFVVLQIIKNKIVVEEVSASEAEVSGIETLRAGKKRAKFSYKGYTTTFNYTVLNQLADTFTVNYKADANGSISGNENQIIISGGIGEQVSAIADYGYAFLKWSDEINTYKRQDKNITQNASFVAHFVQLESLVVNNYEELNVALNLNVNILLGADIDFGGSEITQIENYTKAFDGNGFVIKNFVLTNTARPIIAKLGGSIVNLCFSYDKQGATYNTLIGSVLQNAVVSGVYVRATSINVANQNFGLICAENYGTIEYSYTQGKIFGNQNLNIGGICGSNFGRIVNCFFTGEIFNKQSGLTGGISGENNGEIANCFVSANVYGAGARFISNINYGNSIYYSFGKSQNPELDANGVEKHNLLLSLKNIGFDNGFSYQNNLPQKFAVQAYLVGENKLNTISINSVDDFNFYFTDENKSLCFDLGESIELNKFAPLKQFDGYFNGNNNTIDGLIIQTIAGADGFASGFVLQNNGEILNTTFIAINNTFIASKSTTIGGVVAKNAGLIYNVKLTLNLQIINQPQASTLVIGGVSGILEAGGTIVLTSVDFDFSTNNASEDKFRGFTLGAIAGKAIGGRITKSYVKLKVTCSSAKIEGTNFYIGGFLGSATSQTVVENSYTAGVIKVNSAINVAGFCPQFSGTILNSYANVKIEGKGLDVCNFVVLNVSNPKIENCFTTGTNDGAVNVLNKFDFTNKPTWVKNCFQLSARSGFVGQVTSANLADKSWFLNALKFDENIWNLNELASELPTLK